jgi:hypothetical protein
MDPFRTLLAFEDDRPIVDLNFSWWRRFMARTLVRWGVLKRFVAHDTNGVLDPKKAPEFNNSADALHGLQFARDTWTLTGDDCTGLGILDRCTGKRYSPSPQKLIDILDEYCETCGARGDTPCDVGLHG